MMMLADIEGLSLIVPLAWVIVGGFVGLRLGEDRGHMIGGLALGAMFAPLGWIVLLLMPRDPEDEAAYQLQVEAAKERQRRAAKRAAAADPRHAPQEG